MDPSASFGQGGTYLPGSSLNNSKTIYTDDIGRMHFMGKGGYSGVRNLQMQEMQAGAVNQAAQDISISFVEFVVKL